MRSLVTLPTVRAARDLQLVLRGHEIRTDVRDDEDGAVLWVLDDSQLDAARLLVERWQAAPHDAELRSAAEHGKLLETDAQRRDKAYARRVQEAKVQLHGAQGGAFVTKGMVALSVAASVAILQGMGQPVLQWLQLSAVWPPTTFLPEVMAGEVWRLVTPIFLHFGILHLGFDCYWTWMLGHRVEWRKGSLWLGGGVLWMAVFSNLAQGFLVGPNFGGLSGVVYGLAAYLWLKGRYDSGDRIGLDDRSALILAVWGAAGFLGVIGNIANWAHLGGAVSGALWFIAETRVIEPIKRARRR